MNNYILKSDEIATCGFINMRNCLIRHSLEFVQAHMPQLKRIYTTKTSEDITVTGLNNAISKISTPNSMDGCPQIYLNKYNIDLIKTHMGDHESFKPGFLYGLYFQLNNLDSSGVARIEISTCEKVPIIDINCRNLADFLNFDPDSTIGCTDNSPNVFIVSYNARWYCDVIINFCMDTVFGPLNFIKNKHDFYTALCAMNYMSNNIIQDNSVGIHSTSEGEKEIHVKGCIIGEFHSAPKDNESYYFSYADPFVYLR